MVSLFVFIVSIKMKVLFKKNKKRYSRLIWFDMA